jgi:hypothetical protein
MACHSIISSGEQRWRPDGDLSKHLIHVKRGLPEKPPIGEKHPDGNGTGCDVAHVIAKAELVVPTTVPELAI